MADTSPFSNAGLGMFGGDKAYAQQGMSAPSGEFKANPLSMAIGKGIENLLGGSNDLTKKLIGQGAQLPPVAQTEPVGNQPTQAAIPGMPQTIAPIQTFPMSTPTVDNSHPLLKSAMQLTGQGQ